MDITKSFQVSAIVVALLSTNGLLAQSTTPYGECLEAAQIYQDRYISEGRVSDLICFNMAFVRESSAVLEAIGKQPACPKSSNFYKHRYRSSLEKVDQSCLKITLAREARPNFSPDLAECAGSTKYYREKLETFSTGGNAVPHDLFACALVAFDRETEEMFQGL